MPKPERYRRSGFEQPGRRSEVHKDRIMAIVVFAFAIVVFFLSSRLPLSNVEQDPGPAVFPEAVAAALAALGLGLFFAAGVKKKQERPAEIS